MIKPGDLCKVLNNTFLWGKDSMFSCKIRYHRLSYKKTLRIMVEKGPKKGADLQHNWLSLQTHGVHLVIFDINYNVRKQIV